MNCIRQRGERSEGNEKGGKLVRGARFATSETIRAGAETYDRVRHLAWLARVTPSEVAATDADTARDIVRRLNRALRAERRRGRAGHWSYDINRHIALSQALSAESTRLRDMLRQQP